MDLAKVLKQLHEELENLDAAISSLERLQETGKHRSKEPGWLDDISVPVEEARKRKGKALGKAAAPKQQGQGVSGESD